MGIFSRTRDIIAANFSDLLEKAEDPAKMIRMIILEMEETLVEVRASAARTIADQKEMRRHVAKILSIRHRDYYGALRHDGAGRARDEQAQSHMSALRVCAPLVPMIDFLSGKHG